MSEHERKESSVDKEQYITESPRNEVGVLHSEMNIELHTRYAILLWEGQSIEKNEKGRSVRQGKSQPLAMQSPPGPPCPECGGRTVQRQGKNGVFFGCVNYPSCRGISGSGGLIVKIPKGLKVNLR